MSRKNNLIFNIKKYFFNRAKFNEIIAVYSIMNIQLKEKNIVY